MSTSRNSDCRYTFWQTSYRPNDSCQNGVQRVARDLTPRYTVGMMNPLNETAEQTVAKLARWLVRTDATSTELDGACARVCDTPTLRLVFWQTVTAYRMEAQ